MARRERSATVPREVVFYSYPKLVYAWPVLLAGYVFYWLPTGGMIGAIAGWVYLFLMLCVLMTLAIDLERNYAFVWTLIVLLLITVGGLVSTQFAIPVFAGLFTFLWALGTEYNRGFGLALSLMMSGPWLVMLLWVRLNHRWRITHNEFEHYAWGRADDSLARGAKRVRSTYPDLLEFLIGLGAGTLIVYSATGRTELRRIPNVLLLPRVRRKINHLLESQQVTTVDADEVLADEEAADQTDGQDPLEGSPSADRDRSEPL
jgi:hypothetical protein